MVNYLVEQNLDLETALTELGYDMGKRMIYNLRFQQQVDLESLLFDITTIFLPSFIESDRILEKHTTDGNSYLIIENEPFINRYISLPDEYVTISCDAIFAGIIKCVLKASNFDAQVTAHNSKTDKYPDRVIYVIKIADKIGKIIEL